MSRSLLLSATVLFACLCVLFSSAVTVSADVSQAGPADQSLEGVLAWLFEDDNNSTTSIDYLSSSELYSLAARSAINTGASAAPNATEEDVLKWNAWKSNNHKQYASAADESARFLIFLKNAQWIQSANIKSKQQSLGSAFEPVFYVLGKFADMHHDEFAKMYLTVKPSDLKQGSIPVFHPSEKSARLYNQSATHPGLLGNIDWRGLVTAVKDQAQCGSCWAFSAVETLESAWAKAGRGLYTLSPQQLIDCSGAGNCNGGTYAAAFDWWKTYGSASEDEYPYQAANGDCKIPNGGGPKVYLPGFANTPCQGGDCNAQDEQTMANSLGQYGPLSLTVGAQNWQHYGGGVVPPGSCGSDWNSMDHGVQLVGAIDGAWLVRNSWSAGWGEGGYIRLQMMANVCGVANFPMLVTV